MKERPILFSAPMVRALLAGTKTQTRRVVTPQPDKDQKLVLVTGSTGFQCVMDTSPLPYPAVRRIRWDCRHGRPGDRIWGRETFWAWGRWETRFSKKKGRDEWYFVDLTRECGKSYLYDADKPDPQPRAGKRDGGVAPKWHKRPAIFMPRDASRILLEITSVRVERLQDISEADAMAEGAGQVGVETGEITTSSAPVEIGSYTLGYYELWESLNGSGSWDANPWVWVLEFKRMEGGAE